MSVTKIAGTKPTVQVWSRPSDWLTLPTVNVGDQKVVGLVHVGSGGAALAFTVSGAYTVDWGDGNVINYATGVKAEHTYTFASLSSATITSDGYRQAIVTITPQSGQTLSQMRFDRVPTGYNSSYPNPWRDIAMASSTMNDFGFSISSQGRNAARWFTYVGPSSISSLSDNIRDCPQLRGITGTQWTSNVSTFFRTFNGCPMLISVPTFDCSALSNSVGSMFAGCSALKSPPLLDTSRCTDFSSMFNGCINLETVPQYDTTNATNMGSMFQGCVRLQTVPLLNTAKVTDMNNMFNACQTLQNVPQFDTGLCVNFASMFTSATSLKTIPLLNTINGTNFSNMFYNCPSLVTIPALDVSNGTAFGAMFQGCGSLQTLPTLNTSKGTSFGNMFWQCGALQNVDVDLSLAPSTASVSQMLGNGITQTLNTILLRNLRYAPPSLASLAMSATALNNLYTSLGTASGAQTITVSSNPGSGSSTTSIATAKGWTVVGG